MATAISAATTGAANEVPLQRAQGARGGRRGRLRRRTHVLAGGLQLAPFPAWAVWTGTSFAAPQIAGAVARLCQERQMAPRAALEELLSRGKPVKDFGVALDILPGT
jgi:hypothetical protein